MDFVKPLSYKSPMVNRLSTHLATVILVHAALLLGGWQVIRKSAIFPKFAVEAGGGPLKVQMASSVHSSPVPRVQPRSVLKNVSSKPEAKSVSAPASSLSVATSAGQGTESGAAGKGQGMGGGDYNLKAAYKAELRSVIDRNKFYPLMSKRLGQTGVVIVKFTLLEDGHITDVRIETPSDYDSLNDSALEAVKKVGQFKPIPKELNETKMDLRIPVRFETI